MVINEQTRADINAAAPMSAGADRPVGEAQIKKWMAMLREYKRGKASIDARAQSAENWFKLHNSYEEMKTTTTAWSEDFMARSGWLHNVIASKHADAREAYPEPNILPREPGDKAEAQTLQSILPVVLEQNKFDKTYSDVMWQKLKTGTGVYKVVWDGTKLNGLGDIAISRVNILELFWEPGVSDIQSSRAVFQTKLVSKEDLIDQYPELADKLKGSVFKPETMPNDDHISRENMETVIEVYYHRHGLLHYAKFVDGILLYATENENELADRGLYDHGKYPFIFDTLYPVEDSPCGYGYVDLCANAQTQIDLLRTALLKNAMVGATPRYFFRTDGAVNEKDFCDLTKPLIKVNGAIDDMALRPVDYNPLQGNYLSMLDYTINEMRETSGNTEVSNGSTAKGVTAASAIAALQEASGKGSRDSTASSYAAYGEIIELCIELIRQFYTIPRQFRITGQNGTESFVSYDSAGIQAQSMGTIGGADMGMRLPVFDIKVKPAKRTEYSRMSQNELALQFYNLRFFDPTNADQTLACLNMMEFDDKDRMMQEISRNGTMYDRLVQYQQLALSLAQQYRPELVQGLSESIVGAPLPTAQQGEKPQLSTGNEESGITRKARERARSASQPTEA